MRAAKGGGGFLALAQPPPGETEVVPDLGLFVVELQGLGQSRLGVVEIAALVVQDRSAVERLPTGSDDC